MVNSRAQAVIFDLDGTAIPSKMEGMPSEELKQAIGKAHTIGFFCAATGRSWQHAKAPIRALGLTAPCVISGGTQIINPTTEQIIWEAVIHPMTVKAIQTIAQKYEKNVAYVTALDVTEPMSANESIESAPVNTIYMFDITPDQLQEVVEEIQRAGEVNAALTRSWLKPNVTDLHITHVGATKEHAVGNLLQLLGVSKDMAIGIGDGHNDIHLFNAVGTKIAMGNAEDMLKQVADQVIGPFDNNGLATFISTL